MEGVERRLAILFADICGSTKLYERLGDAEALRAVDRCIKRMERAIEAAGGRLAKAAGDELLAVFETAEAACQSAVEMQLRVADLPPVSGIKLAVRIAFHTGPVAQAGGEVAGPTVDDAARIVGLAQGGQIFASAAAARELPAGQKEGIDNSQLSAGKDGEVAIVEIHWQRPEETIPPSARPKPIRPAAPEAEGGKPAADGPASPAKFCLRYRGKAYLLDDKTPILSLGRDSGSDVVIEDRKASRHHARIERRGHRFFYVDRSTNGSYVSLGGSPEAMVRRAEIVLLGHGSICFGSSVNDPAADCATFEYL